jgi:hypothetical protein
VKNSNTNTMFDIVRADPAAVHPLMEGWIQRDVTVDLFRAAGLDFETLKRQARTREFRPVPLGDATLSASYAVRRATIRSRNVLARLPGRTHASETILYGAHWDHLGVGAPDARGDSIYNGAVDNATGVAAVLELARVFASGPRPERSIVFAAWTAEEKGLLGCEYYAANPVYPLETTRPASTSTRSRPPARRATCSWWATARASWRTAGARARGLGRVVARDPHPEAGYFYRSDHFPMAKRGVPMLYIDSGTDLSRAAARRARPPTPPTAATATTSRPTSSTGRGGWTGWPRTSTCSPASGARWPTRAHGPTTARARSSARRATPRRRAGRRRPRGRAHRDRGGGPAGVRIQAPGSQDRTRRPPPGSR